jgi:hypothetical protein
MILKRKYLEKKKKSKVKSNYPVQASPVSLHYSLFIANSVTA